MPLLQSDLKSKIKSAFDSAMQIKSSEQGCPPNIHSQVAKSLAAAYDDWVTQAVPLAGVLSISLPGQKSVLETPFALPNFTGLGPGIILYWTPVMWAGPAFIPSNPFSPPSLLSLTGIAADIAAFVAGPKPTTSDDAANQIATILYTYTMKLKVLATSMTTPPVVSMFPIV